MLRSEGERLRKVIVSPPRVQYFEVDNLSAHNIGEIANKENAIAQHNKLIEILEKAGCEVIEVPELQGHPNSVFTRDTSLCTPRGYIKLRMGLKTRRGEETWISKVLDSIGEPMIGEIKEPGVVEGGDIILAGRVAFIGHSSRTNIEGIKQISNFLKSMDYEIRSIKIPDNFLHIGGTMSMVDSETVLCCEGFFPEGFFDGFNRIEVSCSASISANVICLSNKEVIVEASNIEAIDKLKKRNYKVHVIDLSEFVKGKGGPSCLILPVERKD